MRHQTTDLTIQKWGNSLAVRIPAKIARKAHFHLGSPIILTLEEDAVVVKLMDRQKLTLAERLESFDPKTHGGEEMISAPVGLEKF